MDPVTGPMKGCVECGALGPEYEEYPYPDHEPDCALAARWRKIMAPETEIARLTERMEEYRREREEARDMVDVERARADRLVKILASVATCNCCYRCPSCEEGDIEQGDPHAEDCALAAFLPPEVR